VQHHHDCRDLGLGGVAERPCVPADHFLLRGSGLRKLCGAGGALAAFASDEHGNGRLGQAHSHGQYGGSTGGGHELCPPPLRRISPRSS